MTDERKSGEEPPTHYEGRIPLLPGPAEREEASRAREKKEEGEYKKEQTSIQRGIYRTQIGLVIFGVLGTGISVWQARVAQEAADSSDRSVLLAQKSERDARLVAENQLAESKRQFGENVSQIKAQTKIQSSAAKATQAAANASRTGADAAKSAAITAKEALHVSERAYLAITGTKFEFASGNIVLTMDNLGHIPTGETEITVFEASANVTDPSIPNAVSPFEKHWRKTLIFPIPPNTPTEYRISAKGLTSDAVNSGHQVARFGGIITYNDGFPDTPQQTERFCFFSVFDFKAKEISIVKCNPAKDLDALIQIVEYPKNEEKAPD